MDLANDAVGLGLRVQMYPYLAAHRARSDYFEIISENFLGPAPLPNERLAMIAERYPLVMHGVSLNLLGHAPLDEDYLDALARLADRLDVPFVSDHLCWTGAHGVSHHDLLPTPYTEDLVDFAAERARYVQKRLGRPFALENLSSYVEFPQSTLTEWDFYAAVVERADCRFMLDINNIYVSSRNHGFDAHAYLNAIDWQRVVQAHLAGHTEEPTGILIDTHDHPVRDEVWALYRHAWQRGGPFPTLLEWDARIPAMPVLERELERVREVRR